MNKRYALIALSTLVLQAQSQEIDSLTTNTADTITQDTAIIHIDTAKATGIDAQIPATDSLIADEESERTGYSTYRFNIGANYYDLSELQTALAQNGYPTLDNAAIQFGFGRTTQHEVIVKEMGLTIHSWRNAKNAIRKSDLTGVDFSLTYGPDIIKANNASLFPFVGADIGVLLLKMSYKGIPFGALAQGESPEDEILHRFTLNGQAGIGFDIRALRDGFMPSIGFRVGYSFDLTQQSSWYRNLSGVSNGPAASTSGPFARVVFGIALPR